MAGSHLSQWRWSALRPPAHLHLVGVAGVGMSALAQVLLAQGFKVTGSDRHLDAGQSLPVLHKLRRAGVTLLPQNGSAIHPTTSAVVVSTAIEPANPDLAAAHSSGRPVIHRATMLAHLSLTATTLAVAGTAGKTTVTGMIGWVLEQAGMDPTVVNGGAVLNWVNAENIGNVRLGRGAIWVLEADESDRSLLQFDPDWAVITNISKDHFEVDELQRLFHQFAAQVKRGVVGCLGESAAPAAALQPHLSAQGVAFDYRGVNFSVPLLGRHNAENALHCVLICERLGVPLPDISCALRKFRGIERRLERVGQAKDVVVFDDYAHSPAKIMAAWRAIAPYFRRVIAVWRPHGYGPLALMMKELTNAYASVAGQQDQVLILPVYYVGGTVKTTADARQLVARLRRRGVSAEALQGYDDLQQKLLARTRPGDAILFMGARDPFLSIFARRFLLELDDFLVQRTPRTGRISHKNKAAHQSPDHADQINQQR